MHMQIRPLALLLVGALSLGTLSAQKKTSKKEAVAVQAPMGEAKEAPAFQLMALPYATDALAPVISKRTVELHYGKHLVGYANKLNKLVRDQGIKERDLVRLVQTSSGTVFDNAGQLLNHTIYFAQFKPYAAGVTPEPTGSLREAIERSYKSFADFQAAFEKAGNEIFGSGWVWLATDKDGRLSISKNTNAGSPVTSGLIPILGIDIWEHAYYLDYENRRADHLREVWKIIDWEIVGRRYMERAEGVKL